MTVWRYRNSITINIIIIIIRWLTPFYFNVHHFPVLHLKRPRTSLTFSTKIQQTLWCDLCIISLLSDKLIIYTLAKENYRLLLLLLLLLFVFVKQGARHSLFQWNFASDWAFYRLDALRFLIPNHQCKALKANYENILFIFIEIIIGLTLSKTIKCKPFCLQHHKQYQKQRNTINIFSSITSFYCSLIILSYLYVLIQSLAAKRNKPSIDGWKQTERQTEIHTRQLSGCLSCNISLIRFQLVRYCDSLTLPGNTTANNIHTHIHTYIHASSLYLPNVYV